MSSDPIVDFLAKNPQTTPSPLDLPSITKQILSKSLPLPNPFPNRQLDPKQQEALQQIINWIVNPSAEKRIFTLGGLAGTGKTTLILYVVAYLQQIRLPFSVGAMMGRAVHILRSKGLEFARTIHRTMYQVDDDFRRRTGKLKFSRIKSLPFKIFVLDEGSVISSDVLEDILSYPNIRVLAFGDHGQLKPIGEDSGLMNDPDFCLEEPWRHADANNILQFAYFVRKGQIPPYGSCPGVKIAPKKEFWDCLQEPEKVFIVGFNKTRHVVNKEIRRFLGHYGTTPDPGEKIIILNNKESLGLFNGQILEVTASKLEDNYIYVDLADPFTRETWQSIRTYAPQYGRDKLAYMDLPPDDELMLADYGNAFTYYKSQGSEWKSGAILEELHPEWSYSRVGYTAITRFTQNVEYYR